MTLNDLLDSWLEDMDGTVSRRTIVHRESIFRVHIKPTIGTVLESEISINLLDLLDEDDVPQNSDVVLTLSQYVAAMEQFHSTYHGWSGSKHRWFTE